MTDVRDFSIEVDTGARAWLAKHPQVREVVIAYEEHRCCGGGKICDVRLRGGRQTERQPLLKAGSAEGRPILIDRRIVQRLPRRLPVTVRGIGPLRGLSLDLDGEEWANLLYARS